MSTFSLKPLLGVAAACHAIEKIIEKKCINHQNISARI